MKNSFQTTIPTSTATVAVIGQSSGITTRRVRPQDAGAVHPGRLLVVPRQRADEPGVEEHRQRHQQADVEHDHPEVVADEAEVAHRDVERDDRELERDDDPEHEQEVERGGEPATCGARARKRRATR